VDVVVLTYVSVNCAIANLIDISGLQEAAVRVLNED